MDINGIIKELIKKEIEFNSDKIFTVMKDGKLYVGVSNILLKFRNDFRNEKQTSTESSV